MVRRVDYREADRVLTLITRAHGKLGALARGVRRSGSRRAAGTDLFVRSSVELVRGRGELEVLIRADPLAGQAPLGDARRAACAAICAEAADRVLEPGEPDAELFDLLAEAIAGSARAGRDPRLALTWFGRRLMDRLGYGPQLRVCASCQGPLPEQAATFSAAAGGLLCPGCGRAGGGIGCSVRAIKVLRVAAAGDRELFDRLRLEPSTLDTLERVMEAELAQHLDRRLRSLEVLRALDRGEAAGPGLESTPG